MLLPGLQYRINLASLPRLLKWYYRTFMPDKWIAALRADTDRTSRMLGLDDRPPRETRSEYLISSGYIVENDSCPYIITGLNMRFESTKER